MRGPARAATVALAILLPVVAACGGPSSAATPARQPTRAADGGRAIPVTPTHPHPSATPSAARPPAAALGRREPADRATIPPGEVLVTRDDSALPPDCRPGEVAQLVAGFFAVVNRGALDRIGDFHSLSAGPASRSPSAWYSSSQPGPDGGMTTSAAYTQEDLLAYFERRHRRRERLRLLMVDVGRSSSPSDAGIAYVLTRRADDLPAAPGGAPRLADGKGSIDCRERKVYVWSMSTSTPDTVVWPSCPRPRGWRPGTPVIACARGSG